MSLAFRLTLSILGLSFIFAAAAAGKELSTMRPWDADKPTIGERFGLLTVKAVHRGPDPTVQTDEAVIVEFTDAQGRRGRLAAEIAFADPDASMGAGRLDPDNPKPEILLAAYTGGAHCCVHIQVLEWLDGHWRRLDVGTFDGEPFSDFPSDIDGDGVPDIVHYDDRFAYQFGCYACSWMPPRIFNVRKGRVVDVSAEPRYHKLFEVDYAKAKAACEKPNFDGAYSSGYCAGMVADAMRLGHADEAWKIALQKVKPDTGEWPEGCRTTPTNGSCPQDQRIQFETYEEALRWFLAHNGY